MFLTIWGHFGPNLAYKKILGKFTKVLGFGKTPPHVGKNSQIISFFCLTAYLSIRGSFSQLRPKVPPPISENGNVLINKTFCPKRPLYHPAAMYDNQMLDWWRWCWRQRRQSGGASLPPNRAKHSLQIALVPLSFSNKHTKTGLVIFKNFAGVNSLE